MSFLRTLLRRAFGRRTEAATPYDLDRVLLRWTPQDPWTVRDAVSGTLIVGRTGSGKTSASGKAIALSMLRSGFGGLVLTAKADECDAWRQYAEAAGRTRDMVVFSPSQPWRYNFLDDELTRPGQGAGLTENIVGLLTTALEAAERGPGGREQEAFWARATRQLCRNAVELLSLAKGTVTIPDLYRVVVSAPTSTEQIRSAEWRGGSYCYFCLGAAEKRAKSGQQARDFELVADYFLVEFASLSDRTRSVVVSSFSSFVDVLNRGVLRDLFCSKTNLTPHDIADGRVVVIDLPVKEYGEVGQIAQVLWKYAFQRSIERRGRAAARPVFLWADEVQNFAHSYDMSFLTTCRSSLVATVFLVQNISTLHAALGGDEKARNEATSLLGNLSTTILHANGDATTNEWGANLIGKSKQLFANGSSSRSADEQISEMFDLGIVAPPSNTSAGFSEAYEYETPPSTFTRLRTGGPANDYKVDGVVFQSGRVFRASGGTWCSVVFDQRSGPQ
jgi:type IV secretory pathway TraG/TraD family ATPase VirD4